MFFLKLNFQDESHLHANCLFCILILCRKCFSFQFLYCGIRKHISILIGAQNGRISSWKNVIFFWKMFFLKLNFQLLIDCFIFCLFTVNAFFFSSQLVDTVLNWMHIHILTGVQTRCIISWKNSHFCRK